MNLFESHEVVYHGGPTLITTNIRVPFFVSPSREMAASYADEKGSGSGVISVFKFRPKEVATVSDIRDAVLQFTYEEDWDVSNVYEFVSPAVRTFAPEVIALLRQRGFDSAHFHDLGLHHEFAEYPAYVVFDPSILTPLMSEGLQTVSVKPLYRPQKQVLVAVDPTRSQMIRMARGGLEGPQLRGLVVRGGCVVWRADEALHMDIALAMGHEEAFADTDTPGENAFQVRVEDGKIIYVGNPDFAAAEITRFTSLFDAIDLVGDETSEYQASEWGLPAREGGWSAYLG